MITEIDLLNKEEKLYQRTANDVYRDFQEYYDKDDVTLPSNLRLLYAEYEYGDWQGEAYVLGYNLDSGKFFEIHANHCSCYGLEGQWDEEYFEDFDQLRETIIHRFKMNPGYGYWVASCRDVREFLEITDEDFYE